ncbi:hypothetical protein A1Q1_03933 [Trichosporon asahii var. asahii CBS 2479]|uniref:Transglutaminase-like domain-containing protein n=1 Tax=Trichosporon asahii var. asahii (strain ATCC 90039 / CBS 2479 / JCM 2466 / KCTC 7840 / NBRC 103889/ NCYC 2677 / UAMH 7654) TaxID=1186058 RepID=J6ERZ6_TRIAS|nr:hypothetical protein A1Q1_03933 [Trichosporon asahii var. asahii CBS 2479]EJT47304.1 hypothetical protein A1Q1_03933 [Trichosporon asahii var. asahii CBS 2479]
MPPIPSMEECRYIALQLEKGGYESIPPPKELDLLTAAEFRLLVQQALGSYRPAPTRRWRLGIAGALQSNARHFSGLEGMAQDAATVAELKQLTSHISAKADELEKNPPFQPFGREEAIAQAAASWFKHEFFRWVDPIKCPACGGETQCTGSDSPNITERQGGATRCEIWTCNSCQTPRRFPRLNAIDALIKSREGRCGEFAQLFYAVCLALGLEARYVWNSEDHVWTEFWSPTAGHWVHVDSCEAEVGKPQLYDRGWGKKQAYCLAFGPYGAEDVTRAYVDDWGECLQRRAEKRFGPDGQPTGERDLARALATYTVRQRRNMSEEEKARLSSMDEAQARWIADEKRRDREAEERDLRGKGRESGTQEWKEARGEDGKKD